ncbi:MAG: response regulator transcription factor [Candidatus Krumholzibacteriota bacterium]|nr:response regulator transcription factor [Candidatus Krumholzibacteriota bacterium]
MNQVKIVLVEDHTIVREGFRKILEDENHEIVGEADNGRDAITIVDKTHPDLVIMDIGLPKLRGIETARKIKKMHPSIKVIMLTIHTNEIYVYESLDAGADGYLVKDTASEDLLDAIGAVFSGEIYISSNFPEDVLINYRKLKKSGKKADEFSRLTKREREILQYIAEGLTSQKIGEELFISKKTVENHRANIMNKLNIHETAGLVMYAVKIGLVDSV